MKIAIITDTNSGILEQHANKLGVFTVPMPFCVDGKWLYEGQGLSAQEFFKLQSAGVKITSSQPSPQDVTALWDKVLQQHDQLVYIPMTSGLSGSAQTAASLALDYGDRVQVVDNRRISLTQHQSVLDAKCLVKKGLTAQQIKQKLEQDADKASIYLAADTLKYLKQGGRVTPAAAAIGTVLNIKPVLQIQTGGVDAYAKVRGMRAAVETMLDAIGQDLTGRFDGLPMHIGVAYAGDEELGQKWHKYVQSRFPRCKVQCAPLSLSIACHTGPGALGVGCFYYQE